MSEINKILKMIDEINDDCEDILDLRHKADIKYKKEKTNIEMESEDLIEEMRKSLKDFEKKNFEPITNEFEKVIAVLATDYQSEAKDTKIDKKEFSNFSVEECNSALNDIVAELNAHIAELNAVDLDALIPQVKIAIEGETFYTYTEENGKIKDYNCDSKPSTSPAPKPLVELAKKIFVLCERGKACVERIAQIYRDQINVDEYEARVRSGAATWLSEKKQIIENEYSNALYKKFDSEESKKKYDAFFVEMQDKAKEAEVDATTGALSDSESIVIGRARIKVANDSKYNDVISESSALSKHLNAGGFLAPVTLDLKKCGNVLLELNAEDEYNDNAKMFIEQLVLQFLLAFPYKKIKLRLIDAANKVNFSPFSIVNKNNSNILGEGIVSDSRQVEGAIRDLESLMRSITNDKLVMNGVQDLFEYNKSFEANQQIYHLLVLTNFPKGISEDLAERLMNIIKEGNKAGVFTVLVYNKAVETDYDFDSGKVNKFIDKVKKIALCVKQDLGSLVLDIPRDNVFVPDKRVTVDMLSQIIEAMQNSAKKMEQKSVPIDDMFAATDRIANSEDGIELAAEVLDIPIGVSGGEVQSLKLSTNNGNPHAVVIGGTGSGKSVLLHDIILNVCYKYSPEDVNLYLVDLKNGSGFAFYKEPKYRLPHIKLLGLTNDAEDGIAILKNLKRTMDERTKKFEDIAEYVKSGHKVPRILLIIDEIQVLFSQDDKLQQEAIAIMESLFKQARSAGISLLWASQNIPSVPGLRDKVLTQIGNRISLSLNNVEDASELFYGADDKDWRNKVLALKRQVGLGVIADKNTGNMCQEFRAAFDGKKEGRPKYIDLINNKWKSVDEDLNSESMYVIGGDKPASPLHKDSIFAVVPTRENIASKAFGSYCVQIGLNYITGKPFGLDLTLDESKSNIAFFGPDIETLRDMMGYSLMSVIMEHLTNADCKKEPTKIYYANKERFKPQDSGDLYNVAKEDFSEIVENVSANGLFKNVMTTLYKEYQARREEAEWNDQVQHAPYFFFIHSLQNYIDLFESNPSLQLSEEKDVATSYNNPPENGYCNPNVFADENTPISVRTDYSNISLGSISFVDAFKELLSRAGQFGIHFIVSMDNPEAIRNIRDELYSFNYKVLTKGVNSEIIYKVCGSHINNVINNPEIALVAVGDEKQKVRMYRYDAETDSVWYKGLASKYLAL